MRHFFAVFAVFVAIPFIAMAAEQWTQFRGPNSSGVSSSTGLPLALDPAKNALWKVEIPTGKSSPVFAGDRIFLTGHEGEQLVTFALDRRTGRQLWRAVVQRARQERRNKLNDPAAPTPVTDGRNVYVFFADFGLVSYSNNGKERWRIPLDPMPSMQGVAASPILSGDKLLLVVDQAQDSYLLAVNTRNGETIYKKQRRPAPGGAYSSPILFQPVSGPVQLLTFSPFEMAGFSIETGEKLWWVSGLPPQPKATPVTKDGIIYCLARSFYGDSLPPIAAWPVTLQENDKNNDGKISKEEAPEGPAKMYFGVVDRNRDGFVDASEWVEMQAAASPKSTLMAIRPRGTGDLSQSAVLWRFERNIPDVPSPLFYQGIVYMTQNGGILSALDAATGELRKQARLTGALGDYYASPVAAEGRLYLANQNGKLTVVKAGAEWEILSTSDLEEDCYATPAIVDGRIYVRTSRHMYCFR
jgi:outer membrane protein assembly factor BamB